ncbi:MAG: DNRLRE domain-containing protein [Nitrococcus sp.]|nr:DNRLRE domain-containing protein [Nitrococcus sp.]
MRNLGSNFAWLTAMAVMLVTPAFAGMVTIGPAADATIYENKVNNSNGAGPGIFVGGNGSGSPRRGLISFDVASSVPAGSTITSVATTLYLGQVAGSGRGQGDSTARMISLYALTMPWGEGTTGSSEADIPGTGEGFPANTGDATWNANKFNQSLWTNAGGDHALIASGSLSVGNLVNVPYTWLSTPQLITDVQSWLDTPSSNFGWELINADENASKTFRAFYTKEWSDPSMHPQLAISFVALVSAPATFWLFLCGLGAMVGLAWRNNSGVAQDADLSELEHQQ